MRLSRWALSGAAALGASGLVSAETGIRKENCECAPAVVHPHRPPAKALPIDPTKPVDPKQPLDPKQPDPQAPADPLARAPEAGTQAAESFNPNMYGDVFGGRGLLFANRSRATRSLSFVVSGTPTSGATTQGVIIYRAPASSAPTNQLFPTNGARVFLRDNGGTLIFAAPSVTSTAPFSSIPAPPQSIALRENSEFTRGIQTLNPGAQVELINGRAVLVDSELRNYNVLESYRISTSRDVLAFLPAPADGGVVGRTKVAEDNNPIPRDRVIFNVDAFNNTPLTPDGTDVIRYSPGFETTFADGWASIETRLPFASTLDPTQTIGGPTARSTVLGNVHFTLKGLLVRGDDLNLAGGVGLAVPTGPDAVMRSPTGFSLFTVNNESYVVTPYIAALFTPDDRLFAQAWLQAGFDVSGSSVTFDPNGREPRSLGRLRAQTLLSADVQIGYWLLQYPPGAVLRGLAPFVELHYNTPISDASQLSSPGITVSPLVNRYDELNLALGFSALVADRMLVSAGFATPLRGGNDRSFDYQAGLRVSWYFGGPPPIAPMPPGPPTLLEVPEVPPVEAK